MSSIRVNWRDMNSVIDRCSTHSNSLSSAISKIKNVQSYRKVLSSKGLAEIYRRLDNIIDQLNKEKADIGRLKTGLSDVLNAYTECENGVSDQIKAPDAETNEDSSGFDWSNIAKFIGSFGMVGNAVSAIINLITGKWNNAPAIVKTLGKVGKNIVSAIGGFASKAVDGGISANWKSAFFGIDTYEKIIEGSGWKKQLEVYVTAATTTDRIKCATKWGGLILSGVISGVENYEEYNGFSAEMLVETGVETVADTAVSVLAKWGVGSAVAALVSAGVGFLATPVGAAVAIAAGTVLVTWVANGICKWVTGGLLGEEKDIGEVAADLVVGTGKTLVKWLKGLSFKPAYAGGGA